MKQGAEGRGRGCLLKKGDDFMERKMIDLAFGLLS